MNTFLDLVNRFIVELGINGGNQLSTVSTKVNSLEAIRVVNMVADGDFEVQKLHHNWNFLWRQFRDTLDVGADVLGTPVNGTVANLAGQSKRVNAGYFLSHIDRNSLVFNYSSSTLAMRPVYQEWRKFEGMWQSRGTKSSSNSPPFWSIDPAGNPIVSTLMVDATPYQYECWARPARMSQDADVSPIVLSSASNPMYAVQLPPYHIAQPSAALTPSGFPSQVLGASQSRSESNPGKDFSRIIIVRAKVIWAEVEGATEIMQGALAEYQDLLEELRADQLPGMRQDRVSESDVYLTVETE